MASIKKHALESTSSVKCSVHGRLSPVNLRIFSWHYVDKNRVHNSTCGVIDSITSSVTVSTLTEASLYAT